MNADGFLERANDLTAGIIGAAQRVSSRLGCGFLEKVYENALRVELKHAGLQAEQQKPIQVLYRNEPVGHYLADLVIEDTVVVELKAVSGIDPVHEAQCMNYLRASNLKICLLLNFGRPRLEVRRIVRGLQ
jgi:GxxExxY protein